jgi:hypothetical protein
MKIAFDEIGEHYVTFYADGSAAEGKVCKLGDNGTVAACAAGEDFCGVVANIREGAASVQMGGYCELPYTGTAPAVGYGHLAADSAGGAAVAAGAKSYLIVQVDAVNKTVGFFL